MKVFDYFDIEYGQREYHSKGHLKRINSGTQLISSKGTSQGIFGYFDITPKYKNVISVPSTGTICHAFYQEKECCIDDNCLVLIPKKKFTTEEMIYFTLLIRKNKYKYMYGRQVTPKRLGNTKILKFPEWLKDTPKFNYSKIKNSVINEKINLSDVEWNYFRYSDVFDIERGFYNKRPEISGKLNFVSASRENNGVTDKISEKVVTKIYEGNCINVVNNGESTSYAFYQKDHFTCSHDVNLLRLKDFELNVFIAMFLIILIKKEKFRFNYGRKWRYERMGKTKIKLPVNKEKEPDWDFMENYIKSLKFSSSLN